MAATILCHIAIVATGAQPSWVPWVNATVVATAMRADGSVGGEFVVSSGPALVGEPAAPLPFPKTLTLQGPIAASRWIFAVRVFGSVGGGRQDDFYEGACEIIPRTGGAVLGLEFEECEVPLRSTRWPVFSGSSYSRPAIVSPGPHILGVSPLGPFPGSMVAMDDKHFAAAGAGGAAVTVVVTARDPDFATPSKREMVRLLPVRVSELGSNVANGSAAPGCGSVVTGEGAAYARPASGDTVELTATWLPFSGSGAAGGGLAEAAEGFGESFCELVFRVADLQPWPEDGGGAEVSTEFRVAGRRAGREVESDRGSPELEYSMITNSAMVASKGASVSQTLVQLGFRADAETEGGYTATIAKLGARRGRLADARLAGPELNAWDLSADGEYSRVFGATGTGTGGTVSFVIQAGTEPEDVRVRLTLAKKMSTGTVQEISKVFEVRVMERAGPGRARRGGGAVGSVVVRAAVAPPPAPAAFAAGSPPPAPAATAAHVDSTYGTPLKAFYDLVAAEMALAASKNGNLSDYFTDLLSNQFLGTSHSVEAFQDAPNASVAMEMLKEFDELSHDERQDLAAMRQSVTQLEIHRRQGEPIDDDVWQKTREGMLIAFLVGLGLVNLLINVAVVTTVRERAGPMYSAVPMAKRWGQG